MDISASSLKSFDDYEILGELGRGGMGIVFKARHRKLNRVVALKVLRAGPLAGAVELERFRAEARAMALLQHPNIVAIHEFGHHQNLPYFSMEWIDGRTLADAAGNNQISPEIAARYLAQIARAVDYAHGRGILHRDLKPSNVLIDSFGHPRLTDFGLFKRLSAGTPSEEKIQLTLTGQALGTPGFMPPEQIHTGGQAGPASDIYSLGAVLYFLLTAKPPFSGENLIETLGLMLKARPIPPSRLNPAVPPALETICLKCLEKETAHRYASAGKLADDLEHFLRGEPIKARKAKHWRRFVPWANTRGGRILLAAALVALIAAAFVYTQSDRILHRRNAPQSTVASRPTRHYSGPMPTVLAIDETTLAQTNVGIGCGVSVDPKNNDYWAASLYDSGVIIRSGRTDEVVARFSLGDCPRTVTLDGTHRIAWVAAQCGISINTNFPSNDLLWAIDADSHSVVGGPIYCGGINSDPVAVNPSTGRFYHAVHGTQRVDLGTFIPTRPKIGIVLAVNPDRNLLYATGPGQLLQIIDGSADPEAVLTNASLPFPAETASVAADPVLNCVFVAGSRTNRVVMLDARTGEQLRDIILGGGKKFEGVIGIAVDAEHNRLFCLGARDKKGTYLFVVDGENQRVLELPAPAGGLTVGPAMNKLYVWGDFGR